MLTTPGHGTFPMGHATQIFAVGRVLKELLRHCLKKGVPPDLSEQMDRLSWRMSENRIVAGVHFPVDLWGGLALGLALGEYAVARFTNTAPAYSGDTLTDENFNEMAAIAPDINVKLVSGFSGRSANVELSKPDPRVDDSAAPKASGPALLDSFWTAATKELCRALWIDESSKP
jgi:hypothetical protein